MIEMIDKLIFVLWGAILGNIGLLIAYIICNAIRRRRREKIKRAMGL